MVKIVGVSFKSGGKVYSFAPGALEIQKGDYVIVTTARGTECGKVVHGIHDVASSSVSAPLKQVLRMADAVDIRRAEQNRVEERLAYDTCTKAIETRALNMKLIDVEYTSDRNKILFYFTADGRIDFRELVKELAGLFHARIELRQIGVRDESKMLGGLGICGQPFCCNRFLSSFQPVSIRMAKDQGLSLNPAKISGSCGRLMCCLAYEQSSYDYLSRITPCLGSVVKTADGIGSVIEVNLVSGTLRVRLENSPEIPAKIYNRKDCTYLRGGKRAPVPEDPQPEELIPEAEME